MSPLIPTLTSKVSGQRFVKGMGSVFSLIPPPPQQVPVPMPPPLADADAIAAAWQQVGRQMWVAVGRMATLIQAGHADR